MIEIMGAPGGVEPPTNGLGNRCSIQLSYGAICRNMRAYISLLQLILAEIGSVAPFAAQLRAGALQLRHCSLSLSSSAFDVVLVKWGWRLSARIAPFGMSCSRAFRIQSSTLPARLPNAIFGRKNRKPSPPEHIARAGGIRRLASWPAFRDTYLFPWPSKPESQ
jgi:hypothetical protein